MRSFFLRIFIVLLGIFVLVSVAAAAGGKAPAFSLKDASGKSYALADYAGKKAVLMTFWASWCKPCLLEMPMMEKIYQQYKDQGLEILSINTDTASGVPKAKQIVERKAVTYPVLYDTDSNVTGIYNPQGAFPYTVLINTAGEIIYTHKGFTPGDEKELDEKIRAAIGAK